MCVTGLDGSSNLFVSSDVWSWRGILVKLVMHQISVDEIENPCYWINRCRFDMVIPSILSTQYWASLIFFTIYCYWQNWSLLCPKRTMAIFYKKSRPRLQFVAERYAFVVVLTSVNVEMRQRPFLKTFLQRKSFFAPNVIWYYFGQILKSEVIFYFRMRALSFLHAQLTVWCFFLEIDCINLKNLKAEQAATIHSSISVLVSFCYLPTGPLGTVRWGS